MRSIIIALVIGAGVFGITGRASAELCSTCRGKAYTADVGTCSECGGTTSSGAFKLCRGCSTGRAQCEACRAPLAGVKPARVVPKTAKPAAGSEIALDKSANGKTVEARVGQTVVVRLDGNPTTGYRWALAKCSSDAVKSLGEPEYLQRAARVGVVGVGGTYVFRLRAAKAGTATVTLHYARPWEKNTPPAETFTVTIRVPATAKPGKAAPSGKAR